MRMGLSPSLRISVSIILLLAGFERNIEIKLRGCSWETLLKPTPPQLLAMRVSTHYQEDCSIGTSEVKRELDKLSNSLILNGAPRKIRTPDLLILSRFPLRPSPKLTIPAFILNLGMIIHSLAFYNNRESGLHG